MLVSVDTGLKVTQLPHSHEFARWRKSITNVDYDKVVEAINNQVDEKDLNTAGWMPGHDWTGTVYRNTNQSFYMVQVASCAIHPK